MNSLNEQIEQRRQELKTLENQRDRTIGNCKHEWGPIQYLPDYQKGYTIPRNPLGTIGVDWKEPVHVSSKLTYKWTRKCKICGHIQTTQKTKERVLGTTSTTQIPDFS